MNRNDYLMHYGVKGMKWGVRKDPRYESRGTRRHRQAYEDYKEDVADKSFSPRAHRMLVRDQQKHYDKYQKAKAMDNRRKDYANKHGHLRNIAAFTGKTVGVGLAIGAVGAGAMYVAKSKIWRGPGDFYEGLLKEASAQRKVNLGMRVAGSLASAQLLYKHIEQARAIEEARNHGKFTDVRR